MRKQKAFTIIELIVVIAIIAVLAAVVAVNVMSYIAKAKNVAIKANMNLLPVSAVAYYKENGTYGNFCSMTAPNENPDLVKVYNAVDAINDCLFAMECLDNTSNSGAAPGVMCTDDEWLAFTYLIDNSVYCIDSRGNKKLIPSAGGSSCDWAFSNRFCLCDRLSTP